MKKIVVLLSILTCFGCNRENREKYAIVSGRIHQQKVHELILMSRESEFEKVISVTKNGHFADTIKLQLGHYELNDGKNTTFLVLEPGDNIEITYNGSDHHNTVHLSGNGVEKTEYLIAKNKKLKELIRNLKQLYQLDEAGFKNKFDNIKTVLLDTLYSFDGLSTRFRELESRNIEYYILSRYISYGPSHAAINKDPDFQVSDGFSQELKDIDYNREEDFVFSKNYQYLIKSHYRTYARELMNKDSIPDYLSWIKTVETIPSEIIRNKLLLDNAINEITYTKDLDSFYKTHLSAISNEIYKSKVTKTYEKLKSLDSGRYSPKFTDYENYDGTTTSLDDLEGKYVYIDIWATWCAPCIVEIPHLKELKKEYQGRNIAFVSISIDNAKDHDKWEKMIEHKKMQGIQLFSDQSWNSSFIKDYLINGIPRFILIDPEGKIISSDAPRPSEPALMELLSNLKT